ncbi:MAG: hypothetical protein IT381_15145 [Deltaproteobacteria bacterium]|nr:hypothetical protein [Deltaproteobacteria bacterium]
MTQTKPLPIAAQIHRPWSPAQAAGFAHHAMLLRARGEHALAAEALRHALAGAPRRADYWGALGVCLAEAHQYEAARRAVSRALRLDAAKVDLWCVFGELSLELFDYNAAVHAFGKCIALDARAKHPAGIRARALVMKLDWTLKQASGAKS